MARSSDAPFPLSLLRDKTFQAAEIRRVIGITVIYLIVTTALVGVFYYQVLGQLVEGVGPLLFVAEDARLVDEAVPALGVVLGKWMLAMLALNTLITLAFTVYIARRLGRPILAIKRTLREIGAGNLDVRLRTSDSREFGEIANELSLAMRSVRAQIRDAKEGIAAADTDGHRPQADVIAAIESCRSALDYFQVEPARGDVDPNRPDEDSRAA